MKAVVYHNYGSPDVLKLEEVEKPSPRDGEVLISVHAAPVLPFDWHFLTGTPFMARVLAGLFRPKHTILGSEVAGRVEAVGANVGRFRPGDEVFGHSESCGCYAEYVCLPEASLFRKPASISFEEAAAVHFSAITALVCLCDLGQVEAGQRVLINGASGGVGTLAVQIARAFGAAEVMGVCGTRNLEMVRSLGADQVVDYTQEDFTRQGVCYDVIFDAVAKRSFAECRRALTSEGVYVTTAFSPGLFLQQQWASIIGGQRMAALVPKEPDQHIRIQLEALLEAGKLKPVVGRCYPLHEVADALRFYETGHTQGRVVITM
jgi:NADPH:quinone reductase-like Zn-dependent oxidoreductase